MTTLPTSRRRGARQESGGSGAAGGAIRVRKSEATTGEEATSAAMRPRANTISHIDHATVGMLAASNPLTVRPEGYNQGMSHQPLMGPSGMSNYTFRGMSTAPGHHGNPFALPKLETSGLSIDTGLRTAPPYGGLRELAGMEIMWLGPDSTVNPAQLHFSNSPQSLAFETSTSPLDQSFAAIPGVHAIVDDEGNFPWHGGFENQMPCNLDEHPIDGSSPSVISTGSHSGLSEAMLDCSKNSPHSFNLWQHPVIPQASIMSNCPMDWSATGYQDPFVPGQLSPNSLQAQLGGTDQYFPSPLLTNAQTSLPVSHGTVPLIFHPPMINEPEIQTPSNSVDSVSSSNRQSSVTSISTDSITDATRQALLAILSLPAAHGQTHLIVSQASTSSSLSPAFVGSSCNISNTPPLPSTHDLQRYVAAYIKYFHPHLPFLHIPSLSFHSVAYEADLRTTQDQYNTAESISSGGGSSLILAMAAIGALYEYEVLTSKALFEMAQITIHAFLGGSQAVNRSEGLAGPYNTMGSSHQATSLWHVQALALIVIYRNQCGEQVASEIASAQCATLVDLARGAQRANIPSHNFPVEDEQSPHLAQFSGGHETQMGICETRLGNWGGKGEHNSLEHQSQWHEWRFKEERKRTFYVVFIMSSLFPHMPTLTNAEIRLDLPCDEDLWDADSAESWRALADNLVAGNEETSFASALSFLLTANERPAAQQLYNYTQLDKDSRPCLEVNHLPENTRKPSTFGCLILIHGLHSYIWETRQRHMGRQWTIQETEQMQARVEPALKAWQAIWGGDPHHSLERPNPSGCGPLSADCIPLLDMAYLGLYVNLTCTKEAFWLRDYNAMAGELARGELVPLAPCNDSLPAAAVNDDCIPPAFAGSYIKSELLDNENRIARLYQLSSNRERSLRHAAIYAANSLFISSELGVTILSFHSRELPIQSAVSVFDAAQILAEWVSTVQERVGSYLGTLGIDYVDYRQVPPILLDGEDCKLLATVKGLVEKLEGKLMEYTLMNGLLSDPPRMEGCGFGSKLLAIIAFMFKVDPVWPGQSPITQFTMADFPNENIVQREMALALETQASHAMGRARSSHMSSV